MITRARQEHRCARESSPSIQLVRYDRYSVVEEQTLAWASLLVPGGKEPQAFDSEPLGEMPRPAVLVQDRLG